MHLAPGDRFGSWRVEALLGRGGMAVVYRVRHAELDTVRALKVLTVPSPAVERRLLAEGRAQAALAHPHVVGVVDTLAVGGQLALLMEYVDGPDLAALLARERLALPEALVLFRQIVSGVAAAHARGLIHRDLKLSNVLVATDAQGRRVARVGDFGLVKESALDLTATHALLGTPRSMAPEQMRAARKVDARADLFSLGCVLYELCCGQPPFAGEDLVELYQAKVSGRYPPLPELAAPVGAAIRGCLQPDPGRRIGDCETLLAVLDGAPWPETEAERTFDELGRDWLCPACDARIDREPCEACGASTQLCGRYQLMERLGPASWRAIDLLEGRWVSVRQSPEGVLEHGRRWQVEPPAPAPAPPLPRPRRRRAGLRDNPLLWLVVGLVAQTVLIWALTWLPSWARQSMGGEVLELMTLDPELHEPGADLAERPIPEGTCDDTPLSLRLSLVTSGIPAGSEIPILGRRDCGELELLTRIAVPQIGTTLVEVQGATALDVPWADVRCDGLECLDRRLSAADGDSVFQELWLADIRPVTVDVVDSEGLPVEGARVGFYHYDPNPFSVPTGADGRAFIPWGIHQLARDPRKASRLRVWTGPFARQTSVRQLGPDHWELTIPSDDARVSGLRLLDPAGAPIEGARVSCLAAPWSLSFLDFSSFEENESHYLFSWSDAEGWAGCELPEGRRPVRSVRVNARGYREVKASELRGTVVMTPTREIRVGCAGQPQDRCEAMRPTPSCVTTNGWPVGDCELVGAPELPRGLVCHCPDRARAIAWNDLATPLTEAGTAWLDLRDRLVGVHGRVPLPPGQREGCQVWADGPGLIGMNGTTDADGRFALSGLVPGPYTVRVRCGRWSQEHTVEVTDGLATVPLSP
jgi:hypothetical protein